jgi:hypothetical protein
MENYEKRDDIHKLELEIEIRKQDESFLWNGLRVIASCMLCMNVKKTMNRMFESIPYNLDNERI